MLSFLVGESIYNGTAWQTEFHVNYRKFKKEMFVFVVRNALSIRKLKRKYLKKNHSRKGTIL